MSSPKAKPPQLKLVLAFLTLGLIFIAFFGLRVAHAFKKFNGHRPPPPGKVETDIELIRDWMTIPFISRTYFVPEDIIFDALHIPPNGNRDKSLNDLNREYYPNETGLVLDLVKMTIAAHQPPPTPDSAPTEISVPTVPPPVVP